MATPVDQNKDQNQASILGTSGTMPSSGPISVSSSGGGTVGVSSPTSGAPQQQAAQGPKQPASSGQFVNLQRYLSANQGAGQRIGQQVGTNFGAQTQQFGQQQTQGAQGIQAQADAEKARIAQASGFVQQVGQNAQQITQDPNQLAQFQQLYSGQNQGAQLQQQAQQQFNTGQAQLSNLQSNANLAGNEAGRFQLLQQSLGRPTYSRGEQNIDALLLQSEGKGGSLGKLQSNLQNTAQQAATQFQNLQNTTNQATADVGTQAKAAQTQLQNAVGTVGQGAAAGTGAFGALQSNLNSALTARQQGADTQYNAFLNRLQNNQLTMQDVNTYLAPALGQQTGFGQGPAFGQDSALFANMTGKDLAKAFTEGQYNINNVITPDQMNQYKALQVLAGGAGVAPSIAGIDASQVGQAAAAPINVGTQFAGNYQQNASALGSALNPYENLLAQAQIRNQNITDFSNKLNAQIASLTDPNAVSATGSMQSIISNALSNPEIANRPDILAQLQQAQGVAQNYDQQAAAYKAQIAAGNVTGTDDQGNFVWGQNNLGENQKFYQPTAPTFNLAGNQGTIDKLNTLINDIKSSQGATGSIEDLMSADARAQLNAAAPSYLDQAKQNQWNNDQYNATVNQLLAANPNQQIGGKTLAQILGNDVGTVLSDNPIFSAGRVLGGLFR